MLLDDPNFAYTYLRPLAVMAGFGIAYTAAWHWQDRRVRKHEAREAVARNVTVGSDACGH